MTIKVYPSLLPGEPIETHEVCGVTFGDWLESEGINYRAREAQPIVVAKNGKPIPVGDWARLEIGPEDVVEVRITPAGGIFSGIFGIIGKVFNFVFGWLLPRPGQNQSNSPGQGERLEAADITANTARLGEVVPEVAGRFRRFPDYLTMPRRYFSAPREQWLEFLCCIGPGYYSLDPAGPKVGDTPFSALGENGAFEVFNPGADVSGWNAHENWYTTDEVGGTAAGTAGLELSSDPSSDVNPSATQYDLNGATISVPSGAGTLPSSWGIGTIIEAEFRTDIAVTLEFDPFGESYWNKFSGNFRELNPASLGLTPIQVSGISVLDGQQFLIYDYSLDGNYDGYIRLAPLEGGPPIATVPAATYKAAFTIPNRRYRVTSYSGSSVTVEALQGSSVVSGWLGWPSVSVAAADATISTDTSTVYGPWTSLFTACPPGEVTDTAELDFFFPNGLCRIDDDGDVRDRSVSIDIRYRDANVGGAFTVESRTYTQATLDQIGFTERISFSAMRPEFQVRRVGALSTDVRVNDTVQWYGLKSRLPTRTSYPNWTTMAVRVKSGGKLSAQSENQINVVVTRVLPTLQPDNSWGAATATRDISAFVRYILSTIGYDDSAIQMDELRRLHDIWVSRNETLDHVYSEMNVRDAVALALAAGMAEFTLEDGLVLVVRDDPRTQWEESYSAHNMTGPVRRSFVGPKPDDFDGVEVEFTNQETWATEVVQCFLPGDIGRKVDKQKLLGVVDRTRAWRIGMRRRRAQRYRNWQYEFGTEMDALNSRYMSYVAIGIDVKGLGQSALLTKISAQGTNALLVVSEKLRWEEGEDHVVAYRAENGKLIGPFSAQRGAGDYEIIAEIPQPWPSVNLKQEPPHVYFGPVTRWIRPALVTAITPQSIDAVNVTATNYDVRVYADDNNNPPN